MKNVLKHLTKKATEVTLKVSRFHEKFHSETNLLYHHNFSNDRIQQIIIQNQWRENFSTLKRLKLDEVAFKVFSGNGQDGILLYLLTILSVKGLSQVST